MKDNQQLTKAEKHRIRDFLRCCCSNEPLYQTIPPALLIVLHINSNALPELTHKNLKTYKKEKIRALKAKLNDKDIKKCIAFVSPTLYNIIYRIRNLPKCYVRIKFSFIRLYWQYILIK